jgi:phage shock protein A
MFESLRQAFREASENFRTELNRDRVPEAADRLLRAMESELVDVRVQLDELRTQIDRTIAAATREEEEARTCLRREELALRISDEETAAVARDFAAKHLRRKDLLAEKASVLQRELSDRELELEEMTGQLKEARVRREALTASAGRTGARSSFQEADDLFSALDRMAEKIGDTEAAADAASELGDYLDGDFRPPPREPDMEARLAELKRRMGEGTG